MRVMGAFSVLILLAGLLGTYPRVPLVTQFEDWEIVAEPSQSPMFGEDSPNNNCMPEVWDRWHDACNARLVKGL